jgi:hypothetical protein
VTPCTLPATAPRSNGDLKHALDVAVSAWEQCAAVVDLIVDCQSRALDALQAGAQ